MKRAVDVATLSGKALHWAVAHVEPNFHYVLLKHVKWEDDYEWVQVPDGRIIHHVEIQNNNSMSRRYEETVWQPSVDHEQGGPIIEREGISVRRGNDLIFPSGNEKGETSEPLWLASIGDGRRLHGRTFLQAAMRCYVGTKLGQFVDIPEELL